MGINTVLRGIITIFLIGFVWLGMMPTMNGLATDDGMWGDVTDSRSIFLKDNALNLYYIAGLIALFSTVVWMLNASSSKGGATIYG